MILEGGYFKIHRMLFHKAIWKCSSNAHRVLLITLLAMSNWQENQWTWKGKKYHCKPGEFITSFRQIAKEANVSIQSVRSGLTAFSKRYDFLTYESTRISTKITILNWEQYQSNASSDQHSKQHRANTEPTHNEESKKSKKQNIMEIGGQKHDIWRDPPGPIPDIMITNMPKVFFDYAKKEHSWDEKKIKRTYKRFVYYWQEKSHLAKGCKKDWQRTWENWCDNDKDRQDDRDQREKPTGPAYISHKFEDLYKNPERTPR